MNKLGQTEHKRSRVLGQTCDAAQKSECGCVARVLVYHASRGRLRQGDSEGDWFVKLSTSRLNGTNGRYGNTVAQHLGKQLIGDWLSLDRKAKEKS